MWQPDGWCARTRIGILVPQVDSPEAEFAAMASEGVTIHATRVRINVVCRGRN